MNSLDLLTQKLFLIQVLDAWSRKIRDYSPCLQVTHSLLGEGKVNIKAYTLSRVTPKETRGAPEEQPAWRRIQVCPRNGIQDQREKYSRVGGGWYLWSRNPDWKFNNFKQSFAKSIFFRKSNLWSLVRDGRGDVCATEWCCWSSWKKETASLLAFWADVEVGFSTVPLMLSIPGK